MVAQLSIIIPCYNSELTLEETLVSVLNQSFENWEAIIINDGSTDGTEAIALNWKSKNPRFIYYKKNNEGLGKARNFGIQRASGEYILPLDSDNLVEPDFAMEAIKVLEQKPTVGVVHGNAEYIGEKNGIWFVPEYNLKQILKINQIDACAIYRKSLWLEVGGYDENMPYQGNEDWDLWLAFGKLGVKFHHLKKITFKYRVRSNSMLRQYTDRITMENERYIKKKYPKYVFWKLWFK